jgi:tRNA dimethylallyltransferase
MSADMGAGHLALVGATASGKSALALELARELRDLEIVTVDSMQVYRGMDIGTAKPTREERLEVRHHLLDVAEPWEDYTVARYQQDARRALAEIEGRGHRALLVGGTGLYLASVVDELEIPGQFPDVRATLDDEQDTVALHERLRVLDPDAAARMEPANRRRVVRALEVTLGSGRPFSSFGPGLESYPPTSVRLMGLSVSSRELGARIERRYAQQLGAGFVAEVERLHAAPGGMSRTARQALGYRELLAHLAGELTLDEAVALAVRRTRRFARRQRAWFGRDPRIEWFDVTDDGNRARDALLAAVT